MELAPTTTSSSALFSLLRFFFKDVKLVDNFLSIILQIHPTFSFKCNSSSSSSSKITDKTEPQTNNSCLNINRGEIKMVLERLGIKWDLKEKGDITKSYGGNEFLRIFDDDDDVCLEEVKEAFDVFDENRDGFIDVRELQRVLCILGLDKGSKVDDECREMIANFDENGDGLIDFSEFVKLMDNSFS